MVVIRRNSDASWFSLTFQGTFRIQYSIALEDVEDRVRGHWGEITYAGESPLPIGRRISSAAQLSNLPFNIKSSRAKA